MSDPSPPPKPQSIDRRSQAWLFASLLLALSPILAQAEDFRSLVHPHVLAAVLAAVAGVITAALKVVPGSADKGD